MQFFLNVFLYVRFENVGSNVALNMDQMYFARKLCWTLCFVVI